MPPFDRAAAIRVAARAHRDQGAHVASDPAIAKHTTELFGADVAPDHTPVAARTVPAGRVLIEWVGDRSPFADEQVAAACRLGLIPNDVKQAYVRVSLGIPTRVDGQTSRTLTKEREGLTETLKWGPKRGTYIREVSAKDADRILSLCPFEFRLHGYAGSQPVDTPLVDRYVPPPLQSAVRAVRVRIGPRERLSKITAGARMGLWTPTR